MSKPKNRIKSFTCDTCKCPVCELVKILDSKYEICNIVDENSIYSPQHNEETKQSEEFGPRKGQVYLKGDLIEELVKIYNMGEF